MLSTEFFMMSLVAVMVLVPGAGPIYTVSTAVTFRTRASRAAAVGCTFGIVPHVVAGIPGHSAVVHTSTVAFQILKYVGVLYLLSLARSMWRIQQSFAVVFAALSVRLAMSRE